MVDGPECPGEPRVLSATPSHQPQDQYASRVTAERMQTRDSWMARVPSAVANRAQAQGARSPPGPMPAHDSNLSPLAAPHLPLRPLNPTEVSPGATQTGGQSPLLLHADDGLTRTALVGVRGKAGDETGIGDDKEEDVDALLRWTHLLDFDRFFALF